MGSQKLLVPLEQWVSRAKPLKKKVYCGLCPYVHSDGFHCLRASCIEKITSIQEESNNF